MIQKYSLHFTLYENVHILSQNNTDRLKSYKPIKSPVMPVHKARDMKLLQNAADAMANKPASIKDTLVTYSGLNHGTATISPAVKRPAVVPMPKIKPNS